MAALLDFLQRVNPFHNKLLYGGNTLPGGDKTLGQYRKQVHQKRMRSPDATGLADIDGQRTPPSTREINDDHGGIIQGGQTGYRQAPAQQQTRRPPLRHGSNDDSMSAQWPSAVSHSSVEQRPTDSMERAVGLVRGDRGARRSSGATALVDASLIAAVQCQQTIGNVWSQPMRRPSPFTAAHPNHQPTVPIRSRSSPLRAGEAPSDSGDHVGVMGSSTTASLSLATTMHVGAGAPVPIGGASRRLFSHTSNGMPPLHRRGMHHRRTHSAGNIAEADSDDGPTYVEDDALTSALLYAQLTTPSRSSTSGPSGVVARASMEASLDRYEREDRSLRGLYDEMLLEFVQSQVQEIVHGYVSNAQGAIDALLRSLVVPMVTSYLPAPRGVLKHLRQERASIFLPIELDSEDLRALGALFPPPPPVETPLFSNGGDAGIGANRVDGGLRASFGSAVGAMAQGVATSLSRLFAAPAGTSPPVASAYGYRTALDDPHQQQPQRSAADEAYVLEDEGYQIRRYQLQSLRGQCWVNDQVINYYFHLLARTFPDITSLGSHLYAKLAAGDMNGALRWVRRKDIFASRAVLIAVNLNNAHWTLAVVDHELRMLSYYDSLQGASHEVVLDRVAEFMDEAYAARHGGQRPTVSYTQWPRSTDPARRASCYDLLPRQDNGYDCGVFVTQFGLCAACGIAPDFTQSDVTLLRNVIVLELSQKKLLTRIHR